MRNRIGQGAIRSLEKEPSETSIRFACRFGPSVQVSRFWHSRRWHPRRPRTLRNLKSRLLRSRVRPAGKIESAWKRALFAKDRRREIENGVGVLQASPGLPEELASIWKR